ncbi:dephospho-CoA kinase [Pseudoalteromonas sp. Cnat2-41]|uniref:dephospho-CoA kinase n=1 Tax=unclassified Pseudoalteromonas TaxID=194690 RepID=UPI001EEA86B0|nr:MULTISPECIES: dephospho-CoA kinase [unclassified Pseudoalteromonas]MCF2862734.1 dephospho-CoA kinase [Pseudoalteromonas sp. CNAT2-18]MCG7558814.1 dephospho-CoA kinase [Pseudoalteromonas sp. CNAT2-18.1]
MWTLGLTGGIGSGKSTVSTLFQQLGITVVDADVVARQVVQPGTNGLAAIVSRHGRSLLLDDGSLNRAKLRDIIFADESEKQWLNALLHPLIRTEMLTQLEQAQSAYAILEAPLLFENSLDKYCQRTLLIDVPETVQISRTCARDNITEQQANAILKAQMSRQDKVAKANDIISNAGVIADLSAKVSLYHQNYLHLANLHSC